MSDSEIPDNKKSNSKIPQTEDIEQKPPIDDLFSGKGIFRDCFENSPVGIAIVSTDGKFISANKAVTQMLGYTSGDLKGKFFLDIIHPGDRETDFGKFRSNLERATNSHQREKRCIHRDGRTIFGSLSISRLNNTEGDIDCLMVQLLDISEQKKSEEMLRESEERVKLAGIVSYDLIYEWDTMSDSLKWLGDIDKLLGYKEGTIEHTISAWLNQIHPDDKGSLEDTIELHRRSIEPINYEYRLKCNDGTFRYIRDRALPIFTSDGRPYKWIGVCIDITERKRSESRLKESEAQIRTLIDTIPELVWLKDPDGVFLACNARFECLYGAKEAEILGKTDYDFVGKELADFFRAQDKKAIEAGGPNMNEEEVTYADDGHREYLETIKTPMYDKDGDLIGVLGIGRDITERKQAENKLRESEQKFRSYVDNAPDAIFIVDNDGNILDVNGSASKVTGYTLDELRSLRMEDLYSEKDKKKFRDRFNSVLSSGKATGETNFLRKDGSEGYWLLNAIRINENHLLGFAKEITEFHNLRELQSRAERLETAGKIAGQVAHDFNNLLAPIMAYPDFIREELPHDHPALAYIDDIEDAAAKIAEINQDLLTMGRRGHYNQQILNLNNIILHTVKEMKSQSERVEYNLNLCEDLMNIKGGNAQIHRIIINMLSNAHDAMQNIGHVSIRTENFYADDTSIAYGRVPKGEYVKLTISDTGCGIPDEIVNKILDPFFTTKSTDKRRGSGLGMSVVDAVIKDHNGYLDLSSKIGQGTSFYIYFPVCRDEDRSISEKEIEGGTESILIVDDDKVQREVSRILLEKLGYEVNCVECGEDAIEFLKDNPHDLLILDMIMPDGIDGTETFRRILDINPNQKAIIVSGFSGSDRVMDAHKLGVGAFIRKPLTKFAIARAVRNELDRQKVSSQSL